MKQVLELAKKKWVQVAVIIAVTFIVHSPSIEGEAIWDDAYLAQGAPLIKSPLFVVEVFKHYLFLDSLSSHYRPTQNLTFILDYWLYNSGLYGFHLTNIILHISAGLG